MFWMGVHPDHSHETFLEPGMPGVTRPVRGVPGVARPERAADSSGAGSGAWSGAGAGAGAAGPGEEKTTMERPGRNPWFSGSRTGGRGDLFECQAETETRKFQTAGSESLVRGREIRF